jgi:hypothetical protein
MLGRYSVKQASPYGLGQDYGYGTGEDFGYDFMIPSEDALLTEAELQEKYAPETVVPAPVTPEPRNGFIDEKDQAVVQASLVPTGGGFLKNKWTWIIGIGGFVLYKMYAGQQEKGLLGELTSGLPFGLKQVARRKGKQAGKAIKKKFKKEKEDWSKIGYAATLKGVEKARRGAGRVVSAAGRPYKAIKKKAKKKAIKGVSKYRKAKRKAREKAGA